MTSSRDERQKLDPAGPVIPVQTNSPATPTGQSSNQSFNLDDFDDEFDDDFEAEVAGEYEMDDDEFARQLLEIVDFDIEGISNVNEDDDESESSEQADDE
jgi:hypothetical protein